MMKYIRDLRLIPIAVIASACLLVLKLADLVLDRTMPANDQATLSDGDATVIRATPDVPRPGDAQRSWAQQMFNFPNAGGGASTPPDLVPRIAPDLLPRIAPSQLASDKNNADITGSVGGDGDDKSATKAQGEAPPSAEKDPPAPEPEPKPVRSGRGNMSTTRPNGTVILTDGPPPPPSAERAILERLSERRQELEQRARELDIREGLIAEAEKRIEARLAEIKENEAQLATATEKKDEEEATRFKGLVTMYENMKPRDAAKIFDRLEIGVLIEVASQINPRRMADILAQMVPDTAERLTVEFANRAKAVAKGGAGDLPKIEGRPIGR